MMMVVMIYYNMMRGPQVTVVVVMIEDFIFHFAWIHVRTANRQQQKQKVEESAAAAEVG